MEQTPVAALLSQEAAQPAPAADVPAPEGDIALRLRAQELITQARTIQALLGADVLAVYNTDVEVRARVLSGEMDFVDVYKTMRPAPTPPAPVRTANAAPAAAVDVSAMTDDQFAKLNALLAKGGKIDMNV